MRSPVRKEDNVGFRLVAQLKGGSGLHDNKTSSRQLESLGWVTKKHRQGSLDDAKHLFLNWLPVATATRPGRIAPEIRLGVSQAGVKRKLNQGSSEVLRPPAWRLEDLLISADDRVGHWPYSRILGLLSKRDALVRPRVRSAHEEISARTNVPLH